MAELPIVLAPDPLLRAKCRPVEAVDATVRQLMDDMLETMYAAPGIGLSSPQVGGDQRIIVVDCGTDEDGPQPYQMANPEIVEVASERRLAEEGCLSLPDHYAEVERAARVRVRYLDRDNAWRELDTEGLLAACIQHELEHLDGVLFVDHLTPLRRGLILRKMKKYKRQQQLKAA